MTDTMGTIKKGQETPASLSEQGTNSAKKFIPEGVRFQPGQSGNPGGRPKKKPITEIYERILEDPENLEAIRKAILKTLSRGSMAMVLLLREMTDRVEGKVSQPIEAGVTMNLAEAIAEGRKRVAARGKG